MSELSLCKNNRCSRTINVSSGMLIYEFDDQRMKMDKTVKKKKIQNVYRLGYREGLHLNVSRGSNRRLPRLTGRTNKTSMRCMLQTFLWQCRLVERNREAVGPVGYLRLMRRALSRPSRSLARTSPLFTSSSATFSATADRLVAFRSKRTAPGHI